MMKNKMMFAVLCTILLGGCGITASTTNNLVDKEEPIHPDEKLIHRFQQRGFEVKEQEQATPSEHVQEKKEKESEISAAENMAKHEDWTFVKLATTEDTKGLFKEQTIQYFKEDLLKNYPPPRKNSIDAIGTVIYESSSGFILDGLLRNGYEKKAFTLEQLQDLQLKLVTANNHRWIVTTLKQVDGIKDLKAKEAVPFRLIISKEEVKIPEFDYTQFSYYAVIEQPKLKKNEKEGENDAKSESSKKDSQ